MCKTPIGARFIVASKNKSTTQSHPLIQYPNFQNDFYNQIEGFHNKSFFYSSFKDFWVVQNYFPIVTKINKINVNSLIYHLIFNHLT